MSQNKKAERYQRIYDQLKDLLAKPGNNTSRMATTVALLHHKMNHFFWTGFYLLDHGELIAGPYQGPVACQMLEKNTGVCWAAIHKGETIVVPNVHEFPGHIACDSRSNSEIVVPLKNKSSEIIGVLDVDSKDYDAFDNIDKIGLERIIDLLMHISS